MTVTQADTGQVVDKSQKGRGTRTGLRDRRRSHDASELEGGSECFVLMAHSVRTLGTVALPRGPRREQRLREVVGRPAATAMGTGAAARLARRLPCPSVFPFAALASSLTW